VSELPDVEISVPPRPELVALVRHVVGATARMGGLTPDSVEYAKLAVSEACTNAVVMTARARRTDPVNVTAELEGDRLRVVVTDRGEYPDDGEIVEEVEPTSLDFTFERGLSLPLIQGLVDDLDIAPREGGGMVVTMTLIEDGEG
jgi:anti-sigma regulatory factor (Ser/Thr protein kinase)